MGNLEITEDEFLHYVAQVDEDSIPIYKSYSQSKFTSVQTIQKIDREEHNVFGWASVGYRKDGSLVFDHQGDFLDNVHEIEKAAYDFAMNCRDTGTMHAGPGNKGTLIESFVTSPEKCRVMGIPQGSLPVGWWTGFHITDQDAWNGIKKGHYRSFSVQGIGKREEVYI